MLLAVLLNSKESSSGSLDFAGVVRVVVDMAFLRTTARMGIDAMPLLERP
jgi:hypothetical protein